MLCSTHSQTHHDRGDVEAIAQYHAIELPILLFLCRRATLHKISGSDKRQEALASGTCMKLSRPMRPKKAEGVFATCREQTMENLETGAKGI